MLLGRAVTHPLTSMRRSFPWFPRDRRWDDTWGEDRCQGGLLFRL